jgi:hypothetical protein
MSDNKIGGKKITSVQSTESTKKIDSLDSIDSVDKVRAAQSVGGVGAVGGVGKRQGTRIMSAAERQHLFDMVQDEADKLFKDLPEERRKIVSDAVKMAIDAGSIEEE